MFAPTEDRDKAQRGRGFTHKRGDVVSITSERLGALINIVNDSNRVAQPPGAVDFINKLLEKRLA